MAQTSSSTASARATTATYAAFIAAGFLTATWAGRIPQLKEALGLDSGTWGLVLLSMAAGSVSALPSAGAIINKLGAKWAVRTFSTLSGLAMVGIGFGYLVGVLPVVISLYLMGFGLGVWDVAMNVQAAQVERALGRTIRARFHAGYSVGTVAAALVGAALIAVGFPIWAHLAIVGVGLAAIVFYSVRNFLPEDTTVSTPQVGTDTLADPADVQDVQAVPKKTFLQIWSEPRTLAIGLFVLVFAFAEGTAIDWIGLGLIEDHGTKAAYGTLGLAVFLATMTLTRWFGNGLLDRYGRVPVLRGLAAMTLIGVLVFVLAPTSGLAFLGAAIWGIGASLGFPVGMSAGGDDPANAAMRVSVVASVGYVAFLGGPPLVGLLAEHFDVLHAMLVVAAVTPVGFFLATFLREPKRDVASLVEGGTSGVADAK